MEQSSGDVIDQILGDARTERVIGLRNRKPELVEQMQAYYSAIFAPSPDSAAELSQADRMVAAIRTASHTGSASVVDWYGARAREAGVTEEQIDRARDVATSWPSGDRLGPVMRHIDLVTARPVDSSRADIQALLDTGLSPAGVVVLSQVVAYVSYQLRLIAVFRALGES